MLLFVVNVVFLVVVVHLTTLPLMRLIICHFHKSFEKNDKNMIESAIFLSLVPVEIYILLLKIELLGFIML